MPVPSSIRSVCSAARARGRKGSWPSRRSRARRSPRPRPAGRGHPGSGRIRCPVDVHGHTVAPAPSGRSPRGVARWGRVRMPLQVADHGIPVGARSIPTVGSTARWAATDPSCRHPLRRIPDLVARSSDAAAMLPPPDRPRPDVGLRDARPVPRDRRGAPRYGRLLDRAAERGLLDPAEYEVRLRELAEATSIDADGGIVTELPVLVTVPAPPAGRRRRSARCPVRRSAGRRAPCRSVRRSARSVEDAFGLSPSVRAGPARGSSLPLVVAILWWPWCSSPSTPSTWCTCTARPGRHWRPRGRWSVALRL